jgi:hypothetical protein
LIFFLLLQNLIDFETLKMSVYDITQSTPKNVILDVAGINAGFINLVGRPGFMATQVPTSSNVTGNGTAVNVQFNNIIHNNTSAYNPSTGHFTAPIAGFYSFSVIMPTNGYVSANDNSYLALAVNGTDTYLYGGAPPLVDEAMVINSVYLSGSTIIYMNVGDVVKVVFAVSGNSTNNVSFNLVPAFSGFFLG